MLTEYLPKDEKIIKIFKSLGYTENQDIGDFWEANMQTIVDKVVGRFGKSYEEHLKSQMRWLTKIGAIFQQKIIEYIDGRKILTSKQVDFTSFSFIYKNITYTKVNTFDLSGEFQGEFSVGINEKTDKNIMMNCRPFGATGEVNLSGIDLSGESIYRRQFIKIQMKYVNFSEAYLGLCTFASCDLSYSIFKKTTLSETIFKRTMMNYPNLEKTHFKNIKFNDDMIHHDTSFYKEPSYLYLVCNSGSTSDKHTTFKNCDTSLLTQPRNKKVKNHIDWYQHIDYQLENSKELSGTDYFLSKISIVCTKSWTSYWALGFTALLINLLFAVIYYMYPESLHFDNVKGLELFTSFYYSIVTFTTLGYGEIYPTSWGIRLVVIFEVLLGYVTLGSFIFMIGHKASNRY